MGAELTQAQLRRTALRPIAPWTVGDGGMALFAVLALPAGVFYLRLSDSYALGTALAIGWLLCLRWTPPGRLATTGLPIASVGRVTAWTALVVVLHLMMAASFQPINLGRAFGSLPLLVLMLLASATFAGQLAAVPERRFERGMRHLIVVMLMVALLGLLGLAIPPFQGEPWRRPFFPFAEPAGFALPFCPLFIYMSVKARGTQRWGVVVLGLASVLLLQTLTLVVGIALAACVALRKRELLVFAALSAAAMTTIDLTYYLERVDFGAEGTTNLSNLVYVQGWQLLWEGLERSQWLGQGFQQLGIHGTEVEAAKIIEYLLQGGDLNLLDGGFFLVKLVAEFGVIGIAVAAAAVVRIARSMLVLRRVSTGKSQLPSVEVLAHATIVVFLLHIFVRSAGYFTGEVLMALTAFWIAASARKWHCLRCRGSRRLEILADQSHS